ncbi:MAG: IMP dehydrogenase [Alphaproteobacteria bacterium]|jgi:IMP dehydrogenase|nr:IMP dehydrogenase [Alphaproteobacteria bacterium]
MTQSLPVPFPHYLTFDDVLLLPGYSEIIPADVDLSVQLGIKLTLKIPILSAPMDTLTESNMAIAIGKIGGLGIIHRNLTIDQQVTHLKSALDAGVKVGVAVGFGADFESRIQRLAGLKPHVICVDSAHGHTKNIIQATRYIKKYDPSILLIAGNIATYEGAKSLFEAGADIVKVGMGAGSICTTRIVSGVGVPQLSAIFDAAKAAKEFNRPIIADGGLRTSGDIVKALAAGASAVMLGSMLAGTEESVGEVIEYQQKRYKSYRGMGSIKSMVQGSATRYGQHYTPGEQQKLVPEGVEGLVPYRGPLAGWMHQILGGVRAGFGYVGAVQLQQLQQKARFVTISTAGVLESHPHSITHTSSGQ